MQIYTHRPSARTEQIYTKLWQLSFIKLHTSSAPLRVWIWNILTNKICFHAVHLTHLITTHHKWITRAGPVSWPPADLQRSVLFGLFLETPHNNRRIITPQNDEELSNAIHSLPCAPLKPHTRSGTCGRSLASYFLTARDDSLCQTDKLNRSSV